jgi:hypothetical protein
MDSNQRRTTPTVLQGGHEITLTSHDAPLRPISARSPNEQLDRRGERHPLARTPAVGILVADVWTLLPWLRVRMDGVLGTKRSSAFVLGVVDDLLVVVPGGMSTRALLADLSATAAVRLADAAEPVVGPTRRRGRGRHHEPAALGDGHPGRRVARRHLRVPRRPDGPPWACCSACTPSASGSTCGLIKVAVGRRSLPQPTYPVQVEPSHHRHRV